MEQVDTINGWIRTVLDRGREGERGGGEEIRMIGIR